MRKISGQQEELEGLMNVMSWIEEAWRLSTEGLLRILENVIFC